MRVPNLAAAAAITLFASTASAQGVYKCTGPDGSVSYQDRPCPEATDEKKVTVGKPAAGKAQGYSGKVITIPGIGEAAVLVFDYMETIVRADGDRSTTIGIRSKPGAPAKMSMMMTFMPNTKGAIPSRQQQESSVKSIAMQQIGGGFHDFEMYELDAKSGVGLVTVLDDPRFPSGTAPDGEYATMTAGQVASDQFIVALTILTDGVDNKGFTDAMAIARTFVVAPEIIAVNQGDKELQLPPAPAGFSWQRAPEIKGAFLRPHGWHYDTRVKSGDHAYFISVEPNVEPDGFDTGLTINVQTDVPAKTGMQPSVYAAQFIQAGAGELEVLEDPFSASRGPFQSHGALFTANDPDKGDFNAYMVAIANDSTGTVYFCIFEAPADEWEASWAIGELMLEKLVIDDSI